ncbi:MAG: HAD family hydrolase [Halanaerobiales bacterium]
MILYVSDLDGTLLNSLETISKNSLNILNELIDRGLNFTIATARSQESAKNIIEPLNLKNPVIFHNGVFIYDPVRQENIMSFYIPSSMVKGIIEEFLQQDVLPFVYTYDKIEGYKVYYKELTNDGEKMYVESRLKNGDKRFTKIDDLSIAYNKNVICINAIGGQTKLRPVYEKLSCTYDLTYHFAEDIYVKHHWLEITDKYANKKSAVLFLKKHLNADRIVCFGDNLNDLSMFEVSDESYAVQNAHQNIKDIATDIINSNNDDGVANYIKEVYSF